VDAGDTEHISDASCGLGTFPSYQSLRLLARTRIEVPALGSELELHIFKSFVTAQDLRLSELLFHSARDVTLQPSFTDGVPVPNRLSTPFLPPKRPCFTSSAPTSSKTLSQHGGLQKVLVQVSKRRHRSAGSAFATWETRPALHIIDNLSSLLD